jgi:hypothetical protein
MNSNWLLKGNHKSASNSVFTQPNMRSLWAEDQQAPNGISLWMSTDLAQFSHLLARFKHCSSDLVSSTCEQVSKIAGATGIRAACAKWRNAMIKTKGATAIIYGSVPLLGSQPPGRLRRSGGFFMGLS